MNKNKIIYKLTIEDIQDISQENLVRELSSEEINKILDSIASRVPWFDAIYESKKEN